MIHFRAYKHYSIGTYSAFLQAQKRMERAQELHPDRCYVITVNSRSWASKYKVEQVKQVDLRIDMPPEPRLEDYAAARDHVEAKSRWSMDLEYRIEDLHKALRSPLNG